MRNILNNKSILFTIFLLFHSGLFARPTYPFWDNIHLKQNDRWYVKQGNQYVRIDLNNIFVVFKNEFGKKERDSLLEESHCVVQKINPRNEYQIKINSSTEYFHFLRQITFNKNIEHLTIKTLGNDRLIDSLVTEIRLRDKLFIKKSSTWYLSQAGQLYEIAADVVSLKFKKDIENSRQKTFLEQNHYQVIGKDRLEICDVQILPQRHAIFHFIQLYQNPLLEIVEISLKRN